MQTAPQTTTTTPPTTSELSPLAPGPIPTPPPTSDPELQRFNQLYADCRAGQDKIVSMQGNAYDSQFQDRCITAMKQAISQYCEDFQTLDRAKCDYVTREDVSLFLSMNDYLLGYGETPSNSLFP